ncbi:HupE/UreJ family protein [Rhizobium bangladeshense]|uniref:HupE/UreJ family protein n=1 Tax=Rhizobium bangladeshense TaxID=1138189 RepID=A0ABS7LQA4_9HYPH|nr:HupE/UreJ family protein [Rhizobium bangladeshense]MBX4870428.1 HupE/UreJ family protein [Rhizobium bangladeshense]MBX4876084.1 HupE/UreJ family protein [Rhizobium bangladeshense]MBX4886970.1 HupE/UreJ family protein [Rhizobium bangladeshense]MBX4905212.1 HupE/UreJ family protein [Rhizobium bangladeshense]MBY3593465.1 HupE/UreJ family protein [Rhizobium bangladeshense]
MKSVLKSGLLALASLALPAVASAHPAVGDAAGFSHGFAHPMSGLDHVLAMVMVGVVAFQLGGRAIALLPVTFVLMMASGGALGVAGVALPYVETGIALSVVVLGIMVAINVRAPLAAALAMAGLFAVFHGHAHGAEMPEDAAGAAYAAGFMIATGLLHGAGLALGYVIGRAGERQAVFVTRAAGGVASLSGLGILAGLI